MAIVFPYIIRFEAQDSIKRISHKRKVVHYCNKRKVVHYCNKRKVVHYCNKRKVVHYCNKMKLLLVVFSLLFVSLPVQGALYGHHWKDETSPEGDDKRIANIYRQLNKIKSDTKEIESLMENRPRNKRKITRKSF